MIRLKEFKIQTIVEVVTVVGDLVGQIRNLRFERRLRMRRAFRALVKLRVLLQSLAHFMAEIEAGEFRVARLDHVHDAQALCIVIESAVPAHQFIERLLPRVAERRMPEVVRERDGLGEVFIQRERAGDGARDVGDLESVRESRAQMIAGAIEKYLRLVFQAAECAAVDDPSAVTLVFRAVRVGWLFMCATGCIAAFLRPWRERHAFLRFEFSLCSNHPQPPFLKSPARFFGVRCGASHG